MYSVYNRRRGGGSELQVRQRVLRKRGENDTSGTTFINEINGQPEYTNTTYDLYRSYLLGCSEGRPVGCIEGWTVGCCVGIRDG